ncbi:MAG: hypothetical protein Kow0080_29780 [Candidatus Promineifilaceae bacterium]
MYFLLLNGLTFLPFLLFFWDEASFWPVTGTESSPAQLIYALLAARSNPDIFRLNLELFLLAAGWLFFKPLQRKTTAHTAFLLIVLALAYNGYEGFIRSFYALDPNFYNDFAFFRNGTSFVLDSLHMPWQVFVAGGGAAGVSLWALYKTTHALLDPTLPGQLSRATRRLLAGLVLGTAVQLVVVATPTWKPETAVSSLIAKLYHNLSQSIQAQQDNRHLQSDNLLPLYTFLNHTNLAQKPDIYFIVVESYGSVLFQRQDFNVRYQAAIKVLDERLARNGWTAVSNLSQSPTWGGGSWIAYTSALSGLRLENHNQYQQLLNQTQNSPLPHLFQWLHGQGYQTYRLSGMAAEIDEDEWNAYRQFYGIDHWIRFADVPYTGPLYGWGPALPDQYALHYAQEEIAQADAPTAFFYITQNSHYPWAPLPRLAPNWRTLPNAPAAPPLSGQTHAELRQHYMASILYEMQTIMAFIEQTGDENDIFILIGDHQPPRVARYDDGWETPIHIIAKDAAFTAEFLQAGFVNGLNAAGAAPIHHEGLYTLLLRAMLHQYGANGTALPPYQPNGIPWRGETGN